MFKNKNYIRIIPCPYLRRDPRRQRTDRPSPSATVGGTSIVNPTFSASFAILFIQSAPEIK